jgi:hypothetical protein
MPGPRSTVVHHSLSQTIRFSRMSWTSTRLNLFFADRALSIAVSSATAFATKKGPRVLRYPKMKYRRESVLLIVSQDLRPPKAIPFDNALYHRRHPVRRRANPLKRGHARIARPDCGRSVDRASESRGGRPSQTATSSRRCRKWVSARYDSTNRGSAQSPPPR